MFLKRERPLPAHRRHDRREDGRSRSCRSAARTADGWPRSPARSACPAAPPSSRPTNRPRRARARRAEEAGVLVEVEVAPPTRLPLRRRRVRSRGRRRHRRPVRHDAPRRIASPRFASSCACCARAAACWSSAPCRAAASAPSCRGRRAVRRLSRPATRRRRSKPTASSRCARWPSGKAGVCRGNQAARVTRLSRAGVQPRTQRILPTRICEVSRQNDRNL